MTDDECAKLIDGARGEEIRILTIGVPGTDLRPVIVEQISSLRQSADAYARQTFVRLSILANPLDPKLLAGG